MKCLARVLPVVLLLSTSAGATKIPIPIEDATLNVGIQLQPWILINQNGAPDGTSPNFDLYLRRSRLLINGDAGKNFSYLVQVDQPNWGKKANYSLRALIQDAWVGWTPTGTSAGTVIYIDAGLLLLPIAHHLLQSTTDFVTLDVHTDSFRGMRETVGFRDLGISIRGWTLNKKVGFRGGVYEGLRGTPAGTATDPNSGLNPHGNPRLAGFVNVDLVGSEEGAWLYHGIYFTDKPIVSVGAAAIYQSLTSRGYRGVTDSAMFSFDAFADLPLVSGQELTVQATGFRNNYGVGSKDSGWGFFADVGYRIGPIMPYVSYEFFGGDACPADVTAGCPVAMTADTRTFRAGLDFFFNKNLNHVKAEFAMGRSQSNLVAPSLWSVTGQWNFNF